MYPKLSSQSDVNSPLLKIYYGEVVSNKDPKNQGRVQVRIAAAGDLKQEDLNKNPKEIQETLYHWCVVLQPINFRGKASLESEKSLLKKHIKPGKFTDSEAIFSDQSKKSGIGASFQILPGTHVVLIKISNSPKTEEHYMVIGSRSGTDTLAQRSSVTEESRNTFVINTLSGHYFEIQDDLNAINLKHNSGTGFQMHESGNYNIDVTKDLNTKVYENELKEIDKNQTFKVLENQTFEVSKNQTFKVLENQTFEVSKNFSSKAGQSGSIETGDSMTIKSGSDLNILASGSASTKVGGSLTSEIGGSLTEKSGGVMTFEAPLIKLN